MGKTVERDKSTLTLVSTESYVEPSNGYIVHLKLILNYMGMKMKKIK